jgi:uncharacterized protein YbaR (Trm112 family)
MPLNKELLDILACPKCKGGLELLPREEGLKCAACGVVYPVDEAVPADQWEQGVRENKA